MTGEWHKDIPDKFNDYFEKSKKPMKNNNELQNALRRMKFALSEYGSFKDAEIVFKAAQAYADLPSKIEGMKVEKAFLREDLISTRNKALDDVLKLLEVEL